MSFGFATDIDCCCFCCQQCVIPGDPPKQTLCGEAGVACTSYSATVSGVANGIGGNPIISGGPCQQCANFNGTYILARNALSSQAGLTNCASFSKFFPFAANIPCYNYDPPFQNICGPPQTAPASNWGINVDNLFMCNQAGTGDPYGKYFVQCTLALSCAGRSDGSNTGIPPIVYRQYYNSIPHHCDTESWTLKPGLLSGFLPAPYNGFIFASDDPIFTAVLDSQCKFSASQILIQAA